MNKRKFSNFEFINMYYYYIKTYPIIEKNQEKLLLNYIENLSKKIQFLNIPRLKSLSLHFLIKYSILKLNYNNLKPFTKYLRTYSNKITKKNLIILSKI